MAFPKAIQNTNSEEYQRFILAKFTHSAETKMYYKARKLYKDSLIRWCNLNGIKPQSVILLLVRL